jgi:hypothetical protein
MSVKLSAVKLGGIVRTKSIDAAVAAILAGTVCAVIVGFVLAIHFASVLWLLLSLPLVFCVTLMLVGALVKRI